MNETKKRIAQIEKNEKKYKEEKEKKQKAQTSPSNHKDINSNNKQKKNKKHKEKYNDFKLPGSSSSSGFIPVSQIADKSVLDFIPVKNKNDKK